MMNRYLLIGYLCMLGGLASGQILQRDVLDDGKVQIMLSPQHLAIQQLRIDVDVKIASTHWIQIAPHYIDQPDASRRGFGLNLYYRWYYLENKAHYLSGGVSYTFLDHHRYAYDPELMQDIFLFRQKSHRYGVQLIHGHNMRILPRLYADIYYGLGYRLVSSQASDGLNHPASAGLFAYDRPGLHFIAGVRLGFLL